MEHEQCAICGKVLESANDGTVQEFGYDALCWDCYDGILEDVSLGLDNPLMAPDSDR